MVYSLALAMLERATIITYKALVWLFLVPVPYGLIFGIGLVQWCFYLGLEDPVLVKKTLKRLRR